MISEYDELSNSEKDLAALRIRGDFVINSALDWIDRFHMECSEDLLQRLTKGVRSLSKAMHSRSKDDIENSIEELMKIQSRLLLSSGPKDGNSSNTILSSSVLPRAHKVWSQSEGAVSA